MQISYDSSQPHHKDDELTSLLNNTLASINNDYITLKRFYGIMILLIIVSSWFEILESCENENEKFQHFRRPGVRGTDGGSENQFFDQNKSKSAASLNQVKSPAQLWWNGGRQNVRNQNGNRFFNPYNFKTEEKAGPDRTRQIRAWGDKRPVRRHGGRWPGYREHSSIDFKDMKTDHSGLGKGVEETSGAKRRVFLNHFIGGGVRRWYGVERKGPRGSGREEVNYPNYPKRNYFPRNYEDKMSDKLAFSELVEEIGREIDLVTAGDEHKKENGNVLTKVLQWIEQIKLVFIAFGIF